MSKCLKIAGRVILAGFLIVFAAMMSAPQPGFAQDENDGKQYVGSDMCLDCHDDIGEGFHKTAHGILLGKSDRYAERLCESCHGPGSKHIEEMDVASIINPAKLRGTGIKDPCLSCHGDSRYADWQFSSHAGGDMHCADCHQSHAELGGNLKKQEPELCYDCHTDVRAAFFMPSHHPVREGIVSCLDCHDIHGGNLEFAVQDDGRQRCLSCHPQVEGPFVFEHAPVTEDCGICHKPHGSVSHNLLVQSEPQLCLNCHPMHFHATIPGIEGDSLEAPQQPGRFFSSTHDGFKKAFLTKCTQCHTGVHGSDLPAQSISGEGKALTR